MKRLISILSVTLLNVTFVQNSFSQGITFLSTPTNIKASFVDHDKNNDSYISLNEFKNAERDIFEFADKNFDGVLSPKEYSNYFFIQKRIIKSRKEIPSDAIYHANIPYVKNGHYRQVLDLYLPKGHSTKNKPLPLVIWIHGGGWQKGSKLLIDKQAQLLNKGFALASVNYRLSQHAIFPAQLHDSKAAVRFLRKHANKYGLDADNFGVWGSSAGGHLVSLLGTTGDVPEMEGSVGITGISSRVQAVNVWFGPSDMFKMFEHIKQNEPKRTDFSKQPLTKLFAGMPSTKSSLIKQASPLEYVSSDDPAFLIMHGDKDPIVPIEQSELLHKKLTEVNVENDFYIIKGAKHAFFKEAKENKLVHEFFTKQLK